MIIGVKLSLKSFEVLEAVEIYQKRSHGRSPSLFDLMYMTGMKSTASVAYHIGRLEAFEYITKNKVQRGLVVLKSAPVGVELKAEARPNAKSAENVAELKRRKGEREKTASRRLRAANRERQFGEEDRIAAVVRAAKNKITGRDPFFENRPLFRNDRMIGSKVG